MKFPKVNMPNFRRKRGELTSESSGNVGTDNPVLEAPPPEPEPIDIEQPPPVAYSPPVIITAEMFQEQRQEEIAMETFRQRLSVSRQSNPYGHTLRAPGFDYMNWKQYGNIRYNNNPQEFTMQANALSSYVRSVVVSGCEGVEERRWKALTETAQNNAYLSSQQASRAQSTENLVHSR